MKERPQSFASNASMVPLYHYWATGLIVVPTLYFGFLAVTDFSLERLALFAFGLGVALVGPFARVFTLGVKAAIRSWRPDYQRI